MGVLGIKVRAVHTKHTLPLSTSQFDTGKRKSNRGVPQARQRLPKPSQSLFIHSCQMECGKDGWDNNAKTLLKGEGPGLLWIPGFSHTLITKKTACLTMPFNCVHLGLLCFPKLYWFHRESMGSFSELEKSWTQ